MVSKNGNKLKFSVESLLEPTVTTNSKCHLPEAISVTVSPSTFSIAGPPGRHFDVMKVNLNHAPQGSHYT